MSSQQPLREGPLRRPKQSSATCIPTRLLLRCLVHAPVCMPACPVTYSYAPHRQNQSLHLRKYSSIFFFLNKAVSFRSFSLFSI